ncbi:terpenoid synthase [Panus rudis PR-1116 ss-1]|nr:terpenoid synthase [Panus rudis PR-1116 ss-1]
MRRWSVAGLRVTRQINTASTPVATAVSRTRRKCFSGLAPQHKIPPSHSSSSQNVAQSSTRTAPVLNVEPKPQTTKARPDPYTLLAPQLDELRQTLLNLLGSSHPSLTEIAQYYFLHPSKQLRPLLVLLFSQATNGLGRGWNEKLWAAECEGAGGRATELDRPLTRPDVLNDWNPNMPDYTASFSSTFSLRSPRPPQDPPTPPSYVSNATPSLTPLSTLLPTQIRLAQIVEMIHVASLLHDDVIDKSPLRRGVASAPAAFGNKLTVLAGDFLLGRTSAALSRLGETEVVELIATVIANLVEGEILQLKAVHGDELGLDNSQTVSVGRDNWNIYLQKTYLKTASLMAKGARAAVVLGGCREGEVWKEIAYAYGRNLGIAFQLVDDILDYEAGESTLGKPGGADLRLGLATGPALFAWEEHPEMGPLIERKFREEGDVELARDLVRRSSGVERTRDLARAHADKAREVLGPLPDSDAKAALEVLTERVVKRTW